jgi:hypothetical protein
MNKEDTFKTEGMYYRHIINDETSDMYNIQKVLRYLNENLSESAVNRIGPTDEGFLC